MLVDAPCSGLGTLRRNPDLKWRQSEQTVPELDAKQTAILASAARLVKSGGRLVYATCSVLPQENEQIAEAFSQANPGFKPLNVVELLAQRKVEQAELLGSPEQGETEAGRYLAPVAPEDLHDMDGFFAAVWQKGLSLQQQLSRHSGCRFFGPRAGVQTQKSPLERASWVQGKSRINAA